MLWRDQNVVHCTACSLQARDHRSMRARGSGNQRHTSHFNPMLTARPRSVTTTM
jgi:hypothetical protein